MQDQKSPSEQFPSAPPGVDYEALAEQRLPELAAIARLVGGDGVLSVLLGAAGEGSYFNSQLNHIQLDPQHAGSEFHRAQTTAAHEGGHGAITPRPEGLGIPVSELERLYCQIGFGYLQNVVEDLAVNTWLKKDFPGLKEGVEKTFDVPDGSSVSITPDIIELMQATGMQEFPRFVQLGTALTRQWSHGTYGKSGQDEMVRMALEEIQPIVDSLLEREVPYGVTDAAVIRRVAAERWHLINNYIWPHVSPLIEEDLNQLIERLMAEDGVSSSAPAVGDGDGNESTSAPQTGEETIEQAARAAARQILEDLEDMFNAELASKLAEPSIMNRPHGEERAQAEAAQAQAAAAAAEQAEHEAVLEQLAEERLQHLSSSEKLLGGTAAISNSLYRRFDRLLRPTETTGVEYGFPSGSSLNLRTAMKAEHDPAVRRQVFGRRIDRSERDHRLILLSDTSDSMKYNQKFIESLRGAGVVTNALARLETQNDSTNTVKAALGTFGGTTAGWIKTFHEPWASAVRHRFDVVVDNGPSGATPMGTAIESADRLFEVERGDSSNLLLVLSDGDPYPDNQVGLTQEAMKRLRVARKLANFHSVLIWLEPGATPSTVTQKAIALGFDKGLALPAVRTQEGHSFAGQLGSLLEGLLKNL